tara:strand:+ start:229 stop:645 length:417 start_codon:yes stop_codon:yes gene_type:complete
MKHLKENYKRFFGKTSLNEMTSFDPEKVDQQDAMAKKLRSQKVDGFSFSIDSQTDNWNWYNSKSNIEIWATPWDTLVANSGMSGTSGNSNIVNVEVHDEDGDQMMGKEFRYVHSGNMSKDISAYLKVIKTVILKSKLK